MSFYRKRIRQFYYNLFSSFYDAFIKAHSGDRAQRLRKWLIDKAELKAGMKVLDLCTGTGSIAITAKKAVGKEGLVAGVDFSYGMLKKAKEKSRHSHTHIFWIQADVTALPFKDSSFDAVFCAYGFYELKDDDKIKMIKEVLRVLAEKGRFFMMEHEEPENPFIRFLYRLRLITMGSLSSKDFIKKELQLISRFFKEVKKEKSISGNSKLIIADKEN